MYARALLTAFTVLILNLGAISAAQQTRTLDDEPLSTAYGDQPFRAPSAELVALMDAPLAPIGAVSPDGEWLLIAQPKRWVDIGALATVRRNTPPGGYFEDKNTFLSESYALLRLSDGARWEVDALMGDLSRTVQWEPRGNRFFFHKTVADGVELWVADPEARSVRRLTGPILQVQPNKRSTNILHLRGAACDWTPDGAHALCHIVPKNRGARPERNPAPHLEEVRSTRAEGLRQNERWATPLIRSDYEEELYDYAMTSQPVLVDVKTGKMKRLGEPGVYVGLRPSPDGKWYLAERLVRPYPRWTLDLAFPFTTEIWNADGERVRTLFTTPPSRVAEASHLNVLFRQGPRAFAWRPDVPASLLHAERNDAPNADFTDRLFQTDAPFEMPPAEIFRVGEGFVFDVRWGDEGHVAIQHAVNALEGEVIWRGLRLGAVGNTMTPPIDLGGAPYAAETPRGAGMLIDGDWAYVRGGLGLERVSFETGERETIYETDKASHESIVAVLDAEANRLLVKAYDDIRKPANYFVVDRTSGERSALTHFDSPAPEATKIQVRRVHHTRADGLALTGTLYLPPDWNGEALPAIVTGYPRHRLGVKLPNTPSGEPSLERSNGPHPFVNSVYPSPAHDTGALALLLTLEGYAVFDADMTFLGDDIEDAYENYLDEIVADAEAAVDALVTLGVADRKRIGVTGHSFGGMMTANLLAHTNDLFVAGIAHAGLYNLSLTPFGYNMEQRIIWEAKDTYQRNAPYLHADGIDEPLLLLHGEDDPTCGVEHARLLYDAIHALGGDARLVVTPFESHMYMTREATLHTMWEMETWFGCFLKRDQSACGEIGYAVNDNDGVVPAQELESEN